MKNRSIKTAISVPLGIILLIGFASLIILGATMSAGMAKNLTEDIVYADIEVAKARIESLPIEVKSVVNTLSPIILNAAYNNAAGVDSEEYITSLIGKALSDNPAISRMWVCFELGEFPRRGSSERFNVSVYKRAGSVEQDTLSGYESGDFYQTPLKSGKPYMTNPRRQQINGSNIPVITYSFPLIADGKVVGVVGADFSIDKFINEISELSILGDGYVFVLSHNGTIVAHPTKELVMTPYRSAGWLGNYTSEIDKLISSGGEFDIDTYSDTMKSNVAFHGGAVAFGDVNWVVCTVVSENSVKAESRRMTTFMVVTGVLMFAIIVAVVYLLIRDKLKHLPLIAEDAEAIALGDIEIDNLDSGTEPTKNEVILLERAFSKMLASFRKQAYILARVAEGDYSSKVEIRSEKDVINLAIELMLDGTLDALQQVATAGVQVADASAQIAEGAQMLASSSTEQAAAVEELSGAISEISSKTKENAQMAQRAAELANIIKRNAEKGNRQMDEMVGATREINEASQSIGKVIKTIDDIAFQTNILALNAAVEAARAGSHGKGFAVVAEEVRNLAAKSAEAAKDTGSLITNSMEKAELGSRIANETAESLAEIVSGIKESSQLVAKIAALSEEQEVGISQINSGINQVAEVVHSNSATAEQSAAASEEMSGQSAMLEQLIMQFKLRENGRAEPQRKRK